MLQHKDEDLAAAIFGHSDSDLSSEDEDGASPILQVLHKSAYSPLG